MTIVTARLSQLNFPDGVAYLEVTWDAPPDPEGGFLLQGPLVNVHVVNSSPTRSVRVVIKRGSGQGQNFLNVVITPDFDQTFPPFGPVKNREDIPWYSFGELPL